MKLRRMFIIMIAMMLASLYLAGYAYVRHEKLLIHRSSHVGGLTYRHSISSGDFIGISSAARYGRISYWLFTPLRLVETRYWYLRYPAQRPWPYS